MQEDDNSNSVVYVQEKADNGRSLREETGIQGDEGTEICLEAADNSTAVKKDKGKWIDVQQSLAAFMPRRRRSIRQKRKTANTYLEEEAEK